MSLRSALSGGRDLSDRFLRDAATSVSLGALGRGSTLGGRTEELRGRSVLVATTEQLTAALALIELDGIARRIIVCPSDLPLDHLPYVIHAADVETIVSDESALRLEAPRGVSFVTCSPEIEPITHDRGAPPCQTEWILLTSGTTGLPKLVVHTLASLTGAIEHCDTRADQVVWSTFYDIRRYGGLQIFLRAVLTGASLVLSSAQESAADFLSRAGTHGVTHISGTPSHWRRALMSPSLDAIAPQYIRLSGEIADQAILSHLQSSFPHARVAHAFASTEAGVAFDVTDGLAGFPVSIIEDTAGVDMTVKDGSLRIRSTRTASRYLSEAGHTLKDVDGFVDTGDMLELRGDRYYFVGRRDGVINVGGLKVHPEEVEAVINRHADVQMSLVRTRKNPVTGALVVADIVLKPAPAARDIPALRREIILLCREDLPSHKVPASINFVPALTVAETGKLTRHHA